MLRTILTRRISFRLFKSTRGCSSFVETTEQKLNKESLNSIQIRPTHEKNYSNPHVSRPDELFESRVLYEAMRECKDITTLLRLFGPYANGATPDQLEFIYNQISYHYAIANIKSIRKLSHEDTRMTFVQSIQRSPVFISLLNRTTHLNHEVSVGCLTKAYKVFKLVKLKENDEAMVVVSNGLCSKIGELKSEHLTELALTLQQKSKNGQLNGMDAELKKSILRRMERLVLNDELNDLKSICRFLEIFLKIIPNDANKINSKLINHLFKTLSSSSLNFKNAVHLLKIIQDATISQPIDLNSSMIKLVDKCKAIICEVLANDPTPENAFFYYKKLFELHHNQFNLDLQKFYDPRIFELSASIFIKTIKRSASKHALFRMAFIYSKAKIYDESLMKYLYELILTDELFRAKLEPILYLVFEFFGNYRFPFVDYQYLAELLYSDIEFTKFSRLKLSNVLLSLVDLILNDVQVNETIFDKFNRLIETKLKSGELTARLSGHEISRIIIGNLYLKFFGKIESSLKSRIEHEMNCLLSEILKHEIRPSLRDKYFRINNKLQIDSYMSNGLFIGSFGIYDKASRDLVPLNKYKDFFDRVDLIPLNEQQQIIRFAKIPRLKGNIRHQYASTYHSRLEKVLNEYNIKQIYVYKDDLDDFRLDKEIEFLYQLALDSYT